MALVKFVVQDITNININGNGNVNINIEEDRKAQRGRANSPIHSIWLMISALGIKIADFLRPILGL